MSKMNWTAVLEQFIASLEQFDATHPNRWYAYYLSSLWEEDKEAMAMLLRAAIVEEYIRVEHEWLSMRPWKRSNEI